MTNKRDTLLALAVGVVAGVSATAYGQIKFAQGFHVGVGSSLCVLDAAQGNSMSSACTGLSDGQRSYAVSVGRELADKAQAALEDGNG